MRVQSHHAASSTYTHESSHGKLRCPSDDVFYRQREKATPECSLVLEHVGDFEYLSIAVA